MTDRTDLIFDRGLGAFDVVVAQVPPEGWEQMTPCEGWTALDVLGHVGTSTAMGISLLHGEQPTWPEADRPGDLVEGEPLAYWRDLAARARAAFAGVDLDLVMDTPMGPRTVADRLAFPAIDLYVHAWDIGRAVVVEVEVPGDVIELAHAHIDPIPPEMVRGPRGAFGPEVDAPADASPTEAFLAWTGRPPR
jgi:uncharacterized protein (TIGR03086 family)